jgi:hypothetical protein
MQKSNPPQLKVVAARTWTILAGLKKRRDPAKYKPPPTPTNTSTSKPSVFFLIISHIFFLYFYFFNPLLTFQAWDATMTTDPTINKCNPIYA